jgi:hypothetical protein
VSGMKMKMKIKVKRVEPIKATRVHFDETEAA